MGVSIVISDDEDEFEEEEAKQGSSKKRVDVDEMDGEDEDEEEEGLDEYDKDGFLVMDDNEEEEEENKEDIDKESQRRKKKKKRESEKNYVLDEDDYELLQDNNINVRRPKAKQYKRLKKAGRDSEAGESSGFSDDEESDRKSHGGQRTAEEKLKQSLFGDWEAVPMEDIAEKEEQQEEEDEDMIGEEDEMADFIVDEEEVDEHGALVRRNKIKEKKIRQAPGVSSSALQEAHELMLRKQGIAQASDAAGLGEKRLEDEFEPFILSEKFMTPKDDAIREIDVPERIQLSEEITGPPPTDDESIDEESVWIHSQLKEGGILPQVGGEQGNDENDKEDKIDKEDIGRVLTMLHVQKLDLPFIAMYRKESCPSLLKDSTESSEIDDQSPKIQWHKLLWEVHALDRKWLLLQKRKNGLQMYYTKRFEEEARRVDDETRLALNRQLFESISEVLKHAKSEREVDDVDAKFNLHLPADEVDADEGQFKRPKRKSLYSDCFKAGLWEVASKFGFSSQQLGKHLIKEELLSVELEDEKEAPEEVAANFTCAMFETPADVLKGARHMVALEIGCEPIVKKYVRGIFMRKAVVSTSPTAEGNLTIDPYHELAGVKWLRNKPLSAFVDAQWLLIQKAEEDKTLQVTIKLPEDVQSDLLNGATESYLSDRVSKSAQLWNEQRRMILKDSFSNFIIPAMEKEARALLTVRSKNWLLMEYGRQLWSKVSVAPYEKKESDNDSEDDSNLRVMACCWGLGKPATTFVMLDSAGEVVDVLYTGSISTRSQAVADKQRKQLDQQRLLKFMTDHQPHVACLGNANLSCRQLKDDIFEVISRIVEDHLRDDSQDMNINIVYGDESLPRLYENSRASSDQIPGQPGIVKRAVGLGRYLQNPLAMVSTLCGPGKEILSWRLCPLEQFLTPDEKFEMVEQVMVDSTNQVGLDINLAASHEWLFAPLQFISGLGPRKASALQRAFVRAGSIFNRKEIPMGKILRKKVFINAVGFLCVRRSGAATASSHIMDLLDDTRIHPESYDLAKKMAKDVYAENFPRGLEEMDDDDQEMTIEHVREKPDLLQALDIDKYTESCYEDTGTRKRDTLYLIKMELLHGFQDWRAPFRELTPEEEFFMLTGETEDSLSEGRIVQVSVRQAQDTRVLCTFDSGLKGFIMAEDFSDDGYDPEKIKEGDVLTCKIKFVNKQRIVVYLTRKGNERRITPSNHRHDQYYQENVVNLNSGQEKARKQKDLVKKNFKPRMIVHPRFQNLSADEAMQYLSDKDAGESIIRPSSKGPSYLTLTLKIYDGVYAHKDIVEGGKDHKDMTSLLRLGKTLQIDKETFEDLDKVMDRYVDPLVSHLKNMLGYHKFRRGEKKEVDDQLRADKAKNPMRIVYCFGIAHEHPGTFRLSYIRSSSPHHEYIGLYPKGFRFRKRDFEDIDRLVAYFQTNIDKPPPAAGPSGDGSNDRWKTGGRSDGRNNFGGDGEEGHPSGIPRPGRGRGRGGRGRGRGRDSDFSSSPGWGNVDDGGLSSFPGAKVQNLPGKESFSGGWGDGGSGAGSSGNWGGGINKNTNDGGGWGGDADGRGSSRGGHGGGGTSSGGGWSGGGTSSGGGGATSSGGGWGGGGSSGGGGWGGGGSSGGGGWGGGGSSGGGGDGGWGGEAAAPKGTPGGSDSGFGNSEWGGGSKRAVPQAEGGGWSGGGSGGGRGRGRGGRGRGRGRDSDFSSSPGWGNDDDGGLSSFSGAKVQNSSGKESSPGGWGDGGTGAGSSGNWGDMINKNTNDGGGWGGDAGGTGSSRGGRGGGGTSSGGGWGGDAGGRGNSRGGRGGGGTSSVGGGGGGTSSVGGWGGGGGTSSGGGGGTSSGGGWGGGGGSGGVGGTSSGGGWGGGGGSGGVGGTSSGGGVGGTSSGGGVGGTSSGGGWGGGGGGGSGGVGGTSSGGGVGGTSIGGGWGGGGGGGTSSGGGGWGGGTSSGGGWGGGGEAAAPQRTPGGSDSSFGNSDWGGGSKSAVPQAEGGGWSGGGSGGGRGRGGRGRGRGRDSDFSSSPGWGNDDDGGLSSFSGAKVQNSPGKESSPGGWGDGGAGSSGNWGGGINKNTNDGGGWGGDAGGGWGGDAGGRGSSRGGRGVGGTSSGGSWGGDAGGRGSSRGGRGVGGTSSVGGGGSASGGSNSGGGAWGGGGSGGGGGSASGGSNSGGGAWGGGGSNSGGGAWGGGGSASGGTSSGGAWGGGGSASGGTNSGGGGGGSNSGGGAWGGGGTNSGGGGGSGGGISSGAAWGGGGGTNSGGGAPSSGGGGGATSSGGGGWGGGEAAAPQGTPGGSDSGFGNSEWGGGGGSKRAVVPQAEGGGW